VSILDFANQNARFAFDLYCPDKDGKSAGIGLPAKSRAPALVAGWAPRISQTPGFGVRLSYSAMRPRYILHSIHHKTFVMKDKRLRRGLIFRMPSSKK
jgi:hypothetical protein